MTPYQGANFVGLFDIFSLFVDVILTLFAVMLSFSGEWYWIINVFVSVITLMSVSIPRVIVYWLLWKNQYKKQKSIVAGKTRAITTAIYLVLGIFMSIIVTIGILTAKVDDDDDDADESDEKGAKTTLAFMFILCVIVFLVIVAAVNSYFAYVYYKFADTGVLSPPRYDATIHNPAVHQPPPFPGQVQGQPIPVGADVGPQQ